MYGTYNSKQDREAMSTAMTGVAVIVIVVVVVAGFAILEGLVLAQLWAWFVAPTFNVPELSPAIAIGIALIVGLLTHQDMSGAQRSDPDRGKWTKVAGRFAGLLLTLAMGYIVHLFV